MEYNNYYPAQSGHPPPNQHGGPQVQHQQQSPQQSGQMMHPSMTQQRNVRPPGPPNHHQQMQQMQPHVGHQQQIPPQQHQNYQQIQPTLSHGPPSSLSNSPHAQPLQHQPHQQHHNHNHPPSNIHVPQSQQQQPMPQHVQSPLHHGPPMHVQQQQQQLNQIARPQMGPSVMNHPQPSHQQNFFSGGGPILQPGLHHYPQNHPHHHPSQQNAPPPVMHHGPPPLPTHHPHMHQNIGRNSPYPQNILQTELRIIELNRRLQCRPIPSHPHNPLPSPYDESIWWEKFVTEFFEDDATLTIRMRDDHLVDYKIGRTLIPRFFRSYFDGGVTDLSINLRNPKETYIQPHLITLECDQAFIVTSNIFRQAPIGANQSVVVHTEGHIILDFVSNNFDGLSIKSWRFFTRGSCEYIDRSLLNNFGLAHNNHHNSNYNLLAEPITRQGITKSTVTYLRMCMIMEPMQELMFHQKQSNLDPRACLRKLLYDRYTYKSGDDPKTATNKRRKRKPSVATTFAGNTTNNKKSKTGMNSKVNNVCVNSMIMSPSSGPPSLPLASQDVMVVGEPSMMGGDFGDDNERMITRLENTQYDPTASTPTNPEESDSLGPHAESGVMTPRDEIDSSNIENHTMLSQPMAQKVAQQSLPLGDQQLTTQQRLMQCDQVPQHPSPSQSLQDNANQEHSEEVPDKSALSLIDNPSNNASVENESTINNQIGDLIQRDLVETINRDQAYLSENHDEQKNQVQDQAKNQQEQTDSQVMAQNGELVQNPQAPQPNGQQHEHEAATGVSGPNCETVQSPNEESESQSSIVEEAKIMSCSSANVTNAIDQQQPVDNGIAIASGGHNDHC